MLNPINVALLLSILVFPSVAAAEIDLAGTITCSYQKGQMLTNSESKNLENPSPLIWEFNGLRSDKSTFMSGGDSGEVMVVPMKNGLIIYLPSSGGNSTFAVWTSGNSVWGKQANLFGTIYGQQFIGSCAN